MDRTQMRHRFSCALVIADRDVMDVGIVSVVFAQTWLMRTMQCQHEWSRDKARERDRLRRLNMQDIAVFPGIVNCPGSVVDIPNPGVLRDLDGPQRSLV